VGELVIKNNGVFTSFGRFNPPVVEGNCVIDRNHALASTGNFSPSRFLQSLEITENKKLDDLSKSSHLCSFVPI
jgi:hypothetical protein